MSENISFCISLSRHFQKVQLIKNFDAGSQKNSLGAAFVADEPEVSEILDLPKPEVAQNRRNLREYWANYLRTLNRARDKKAEAKKMKNAIEGYDEFDENLFSHCELVPRMGKPENRSDVNELCGKKKFAIDKKGLDEARTVIPLTPLQIYNVKVSPTMFTFGTVRLCEPSSVRFHTGSN